MSKFDFIVKLIGVSTVLFYGSCYEAVAKEPPVETTNIESDATTLAARSQSTVDPKPIQLSKEPKLDPELIYYSVSALMAQTEPELTEPEEIEETEPEETEVDVQQLRDEAEEAETQTEQRQNEAQQIETELPQLQPAPNPLDIPTTTEGVTIDVNEPITLQQALDLSLSNNLDVREAQLNLSRAREELQQARAAKFPTLDLGIDFANSETASSNLQQQPEGFDENSSTVVDGDLTLSYDLYEGGARSADIRRAKRVVEFNQLDLERISEDVIFETKTNYFNLQNAGSQVEIQESAVEDASQTLRDAQLLEEAGLGTRFDVLRAEVELANARQSLITAVADRDSARRQLAETLNLSQQANLQTADDVERTGVWDFSLEQSILAAYQNRVELEQFLLNREISEAQKQIALSQIRPTLSIFGQLDALEFINDERDVTTGYTVGAQLNWTIFDGGVASAIADQEDIDVEIAETNFADQQNTVRLEVEQAFFDLEANEENISTAQRALDLANESLRLARLRFQAGVGTQTDVIEAQTELTTARGNLLTAIIQYNQSFNELQRAITGVPEAE